MTDREIDNTMLWSPQFAFEVALSFESGEELAEKYNLTPEQYEIIKKNDLFIREVAEHTRQLKENGATLQAKAAISMESLLPILISLAKDRNIPAASRISAIEKVASLADVQGKEDNTPTLSFNFQFNRDEEEPKLVVEDTNDQ